MKTFNSPPRRVSDQPRSVRPNLSTDDLARSTILSLQRMAGNESVAMLLQRLPQAPSTTQSPAVTTTPDASPTPAPSATTAAPAATLDPVSQAILDQLNAYLAVQVTVGTGETVKTVPFRAAYYMIPKSPGKVEKVRTKYDFDAIAEQLGGESVLISLGTNETFTSGDAVRNGKASPDDVQAFVQQGLTEGSIKKYATDAGMLSSGKKGDTKPAELSDLSVGDLTFLIQDWVYELGVGVDCSGFVLQAAQKAQEARQAQPAEAGTEPPADLDLHERAAKEFRTGAKRKPSELKPGDAWVIGSEANWHHVMIVFDVQQKERTDKDGKKTPYIEFKAAESMGRPEHTKPGQQQTTFETASLATFDPLKPYLNSDYAGGNFYPIS